MPTSSRIYVEGAPSIDMGKQGKIKGSSVVHTRTGLPKCYRYTGVPYALPPVGERRFKKPVPLPEDYTYDANHRDYCHFANICPQPSNFDFMSNTKRDPSDPPLVAPRPMPMNGISEDCLTLNIWVPASPPSSPSGYPVLFFIHGGWLQVGNPHHDVAKDPSDLLASHEEGGKGFGAIFVAPGYRLNAFGFLATEAMPHDERGNFGFWDQRLALEWVVDHIAAFKGNPNNITIGGLSAGAHSAHGQALYEYMRLRDTPDQKPLFRRLFLQSNANMIPAKTIDDVRPQVEQLLRALGIEHDAKSLEALDALRQVDAQKIVDALPTLDAYTFRAVRSTRSGDGEFVDVAWSEAMLSGDFARWCKRHKIDFVVGEVAQEERLYSLVNPPSKAPRKDELARHVGNYYANDSAERLLKAYTLPSQDDDAHDDEWRDVFGMITADSQVYAAERTLVQLLHEGGLGPENVFRYRIDYRAKFLDRYVPSSLGITHGFDDAIWWFARARLLEPYKSATTDDLDFDGEQLLDTLRHWLYPFHIFVHGTEQGLLPRLWYGNRKDDKYKSLRLLRTLQPSSQIRAVEDDRWTDKQPVVDVILQCMRQTAEETKKAQETQEQEKK